MKKKIVLRLRWQIRKEYTDNQNKEEISKSIDFLIKYHIPSLISQTNQEYICFIQYHPVAEAILFNKIAEANLEIPKNIILTKERRAEERVMFTREYMQEYSQILFVRMNQNQLYNRGFVDQLHGCNIPPGIRILMFKEAYEYCFNVDAVYENTGDGMGFINYAYVCDKEEYFKHFCIYDYYYGAVLEQIYKNMPGMYLEDKVLLTLQEYIHVVRKQPQYRIIEEDNKTAILNQFI
ncbi:MAG: hypothetical protein AB9856_18510 [Cellulosilyticaceae bacterium]